MRIIKSISITEILNEVKKDFPEKHPSAMKFIPSIDSKIEEYRQKGYVVNFEEANNLSVKNVGRFDEFEYTVDHKDRKLNLYMCTWAAGCPIGYILLEVDNPLEDEGLYVSLSQFETDSNDSEDEMEQVESCLSLVTALQVLEFLFFTPSAKYSFKYSSIPYLDEDGNPCAYLSRLYTKDEVNNAGEELTSFTSVISESIEKESSGKYKVVEAEKTWKNRTSQYLIFSSEEDGKEQLYKVTFSITKLYEAEAPTPQDLFDFIASILGKIGYQN